MYNYVIDQLAETELAQAGEAYENYFFLYGEYEKGVAWADKFYADYAETIERLKSNPFFYAKCDIYPFDILETEYRSFRCGWFTVFYTVQKDTFTVWHVRSSQSDFSVIRFK